MRLSWLLLLKMKIWFHAEYMQDKSYDRLDREVRTETDGDERLLKCSVTGIEMGIWRPFWSYSGHPIYIPVWNGMCVRAPMCVCWCKSQLCVLVRLCGRLPGTESIIADSCGIIEEVEERPDTMAPALWLFVAQTHTHSTHTHTHDTQQPTHTHFISPGWKAYLHSPCDTGRVMKDGERDGVNEPCWYLKGLS